MVSAYKVVDDFELSIAEFTGAPLACAVESCSAALFLCMKYLGVTRDTEIVLPKFTYVSVAAQCVHAGARVRFEDIEWQHNGYYRMEPLDLVDAAPRLTKGMYKLPELEGKLVCLSFHGQKPLKIGRGGMILCRSNEDKEWFDIARFDGRHKCSQMADTFAFAGWNMYMTPEQAAKGLERLQWFGDGFIRPYDPYPDLSKYEFFTGANRD